MEELIMFGFDNFMFPSLSGWSSMANTYEESDRFVIELRATGLTKDDIEISFGRDGDSLIIKSKIQDRKNESNERKWTRREFWQDKIDREYILPDGIDYEKITAKQENGILTITIPKKKKEEKIERDKIIKIL
jgi:HSP20 family protein